MWCRVICAALVVTCTFSCIRAGSQHLEQLKDVICVLLLSGVQKNDLDAGTLGKLQQHNVNIYDKNNEKLREECLTKLNQQTSTNETTDGRHNEVISTQQNLHTTPVTLEKATIYTQNIDTGDLNANDIKSFNNIVHFWKEITRDKYKPTTTPTTTVPTLAETLTIKENYSLNGDINPSYIEYLHKMLAIYESNNITPSTTKTVPTDKNVLTTTISQIANIFENKFSSEQRNAPVVVETVTENRINDNPLDTLVPNCGSNNVNVSDFVPYGYNLNNKRFVTPLNRNECKHDLYTKQEDQKLDLKRNALRYLEKLFSTENKVKANATNNKNDTPMKKIEKHETFDHNKETLNNIKRLNYNNMYQELIADTKDQNKAVPGDIIKGIAESIKNQVLEDIKKEFVTTIATSNFITVTTIAATTEATTTENNITVIHHEVNEARQVMQKLQELFDEFKMMKQPPQTPRKITSNTDIDTKVDLPITPPNSYGHSPNPALNPYVQRFNMLQMNPVSMPSPQFQYLPPLASYQQKAYKPNSINVITLQTNLDEIDPIGIPISQPLKPLNRHIIMTTDLNRKAKKEIENGSKKNIDELETYRKPIETKKYKERELQDKSQKLQVANNLKKLFNNYAYNKIDKLQDQYNRTNLEDEKYGDILTNINLKFQTSMNNRETLNQQQNSGNYRESPINIPTFKKEPIPRYDFHQYDNWNYYRDATNPRGRVYSNSLLGNVNIPEQIETLNFKPNYQLDLQYRRGFHQEAFGPRDLQLQKGLTYRGVLRPTHELRRPMISRYLTKPSSSEQSNRPLKLQFESGKYIDGKLPYDISKVHKNFGPIDWRQKDWDRYIPNAAERHQVPLENVKRSRFDDTHLKEFVKSQQKLNDLLEKMLESRMKTTKAHPSIPIVEIN